MAKKKAQHDDILMFACDHNYIWPALAAANAARRYASHDKFDIHIFSATYIPDGFQERAAPGVTASVLSMDGFETKTNITDRYSMATFLRLFALRELLPKKRRILYLDADVVVRHGDVCQFFDADLEGLPAAAVRDWINWSPPRTKKNLRYMRNLGIDPMTDGYFNSGYLLVDCAAWLEQDLLTQVFDTLRDKPDILMFHDQSALNHVLHQKWKEVSWRWNYQICLLPQLQLIEYLDPAVVHCNSSVKPWNDLECLMSNDLKRDIFELTDGIDWSLRQDAAYRIGAGTLDAGQALAKRRRHIDKCLERLAEIKPYIDRTDFLDAI